MQHDPINNPSHYTDGGYETIDFIEKMQLGYHLGNVVKYISRAGKKSPNPTEDLKKAMWYLERLMKIDLYESTLSSPTQVLEVFKYCKCKNMPDEFREVLIGLCCNELKASHNQLGVIIQEAESKDVHTQLERQLTLRRIFSQMQLLIDDLEWFAKDKEVKREFKQETGRLATHMASYKVFASMMVSRGTWHYIHEDLTSEKIKDYHLLFDLAIQFKDISEITDALQLLIKHQTTCS